MPSYTKTVWEDYPSTETPITASNLNKIENAIDYLFVNGTGGGGESLPVGAEIEFDGSASNIPAGWEQVEYPTVLFESSAGSNGNITLSDSIANYSYIEIFFRNNDNYYSFNKFENINTKNICLISTAIDVSTSTLRIKTSNYSANNTNINFISTADWNLKANAGTVSDNVSNNIIHITKVIGYK